MENEILLFENQGVKLKVNVKDETAWLTQVQIAELFDREVSVISRHIKNIFHEELDEKDNVRKIKVENSVKPANLYSLDVIIAIGYRVKSQNGVVFRKWITNMLKEYMLKGYAINQEKLEYLDKEVKIIDNVEK